MVEARLKKGNTISINNVLAILILLEFFSIGQARQPSFMTNGLVAYYPFNGNASDENGNGNNGTAQGATLTVDRH